MYICKTINLKIHLMARDGKITREDIISDDALNWTKDYSKAIKKLIKKNNEFVRSVNKVNKAIKEIKKYH